MDNRINFLQTVVPFNLLPADVVAHTATLLIETSFKKEAIIYRQEISKLKGIDIIVEGAFEAFFYNANQNKRVVEMYNSGDCYGGISTLLN